MRSRAALAVAVAAGSAAAVLAVTAGLASGEQAGPAASQASAAGPGESVSGLATPDAAAPSTSRRPPRASHRTLRWDLDAPTGESATVRRHGAGRPVRVRLPRVGIDSALDRLHLGARDELEAPPHWQRAGWYAEGPRPGAPGPAVIAGHVDSPTGPAVFAGLRSVRVGDLVEVEDDRGRVHRFAVDEVRAFARSSFPTAAVYGPVPDAQLRLITCTGPYDHAAGAYRDNLVVFATAL